jgi:hypothetical protein
MRWSKAIHRSKKRDARKHDRGAEKVVGANRRWCCQFRYRGSISTFGIETTPKYKTMIKIIHHRPGRYAPPLFCDTCGKRITDAGLAAAVTVGHPIPEGESSEVLHVHKGECHDAVDRRLGRQAGWDELSRPLLHLIYNVDLSPEKLIDHREADVECGMFRVPNDAEV